MNERQVKCAQCSQPIVAGEINHVCFIIRAGKLSKFLLTPLTTEGHVDLLRCWMQTESGEVAAVLNRNPISRTEGRGDYLPGLSQVRP